MEDIRTRVKQQAYWSQVAAEAPQCCFPAFSLWSLQKCCSWVRHTFRHSSAWEPSLPLIQALTERWLNSSVWFSQQLSASRQVSLLITKLMHRIYTLIQRSCTFRGGSTCQSSDLSWPVSWLCAVLDWVTLHDLLPWLTSCKEITGYRWWSNLDHALGSDVFEEDSSLSLSLNQLRMSMPSCPPPKFQPWITHPFVHCL